jgi:hypothetical protein
MECDLKRIVGLISYHSSPEWNSYEDLPLLDHTFAVLVSALKRANFVTEHVLTPAPIMRKPQETINICRRGQ